MATGTIIFRPNADISLNHSLNNGSNAYRLIADETPDDNSTYIYQTISSTSSSSISSVFTLSGTVPNGKINITAARLFCRGVKSGNGESASYTCYFAAGTSAGGSSANAAVNANLTTSYTTTSATSTSLINSINDLITPGDFPEISVKITTTGQKSSSKDSNGYARITQIYAEFDYEEVEEEKPEIPSEEPDQVYHSITISSVNAITNPKNGTIRVLEHDNQTIEINPSETQLTLALDNGVDISNKIQSNLPVNTYTVGTRSGASYGFNLNGSGYYESTNKGVNNSAAVARVTFDLESDCLVTFSYINYAEATYDYGIFGKIDTALGTSSSADSGAYYSCNASNTNTSRVQTLTYNLSAGSHFIDVKYRKDSSQNENNDSLQFKLELEAISGGSYTYTLEDVTRKHSLIFVFGDVDFYYIISSATEGCRLFPDGQQVKIAGDNYMLTIVPDNKSTPIYLTDNGVDVTSSLVSEETVDKNGNNIITYYYTLTNIQEMHNLLAKAGEATTFLYIKDNGSWKKSTKVYQKINGSWIEQLDIADIFNSSNNYKKG